MSDAADLIFELGTEELPPVALNRLSQALTDGFVAGLEAAGLGHGEVTGYATPRRLAVLIRDLAQAQPDRDLERRGPALAAAFDADGNPTKAAEGFARSCNTSVDQLQRISTDKGEWLVYRVQQQGRAAAELLPEIAQSALNQLPIPKRMRWGASEAQFVRPVHWLLFLHGDKVVECSMLDATADRQTFGHRFHHPQAITLYQPQDYVSVLKDMGKVIAYFDERRERIKTSVEAAANRLGGIAELDSDLLDEVTALTEWPAAVAGSFEQRFLEVPHEALVTTMKSNQKYFPIFDANGQLMNHFITVANIESADVDKIREGNERVVRPRLADAMFFWQQDGKRRLEDHVESLKKVVFQKQLGSMFDKSQRVAALAAEIAAQIGGDSGLALRAGQLSRCDLMTDMVFEFASMQGIMGRYQAARDGEDPELAQALDEFYMPRFSGDQLPQTKTGIAIALAERIDTLVGIFGIGQKPTGDKDPFALRRAALGALRILSEHSLTIPLRQLLEFAANGLGERINETDTVEQVQQFMLERLRGLYAERGIAGDLFEAVATVQPRDLRDFEQRILAVQAFRALPEAASLAAANKRIGNILKKAASLPSGEIDPGLFEGDAEPDLYQQLLALQQQLAPMQQANDYAGILKTLSGLRDAVDRFFDQVMVMADDDAVRTNRLLLLADLRSQFLQVADISLLHS